MKLNDKQVGKPQHLYSDTKAAIESLSSLSAGAFAYATNTSQIGAYTGGSWNWGIPGAVHNATQFQGSPLSIQPAQNGDTLIYSSAASAWETHRQIAALYYQDSGQTWQNNTEVRVNFNLKSYDTHNAVTSGASWVFTAPCAGFYAVAAAAVLESNAAWFETEALALRTYVNDALVIEQGIIRGLNYSNTSAGRAAVTGTGLVFANQGDGIHIKLYQNSGSEQALGAASNANTFVAIYKI